MSGNKKKLIEKLGLQETSLGSGVFTSEGDPVKFWKKLSGRKQHIEKRRKKKWRRIRNTRNNMSSIRRKKVSNFYGNKCCYCGYNEYKEALEIHHALDPNNHDNVILLCANCHRIQTVDDREFKKRCKELAEKVRLGIDKPSDDDFFVDSLLESFEKILGGSL